MNQEAMADGCFRKALQIDETVSRGAEAGLTVVPTLNQVKRMAGQDYPWKSSHAACSFASAKSLPDYGTAFMAASN